MATSRAPGEPSQPHAPTREAASLGLRPGFALYLAVKNNSEEIWDFSKAQHRADARTLVMTQRPWLLIGSPACRPWSPLQNLPTGKRDEREFEAMRIRAAIHIRFCAELYTEQLKGGRYFLHEQPRCALSWKVPEMQDLIATDGVQLITGHMCAHNMRVKDQMGEALVLKPTGWLTNSPEIAREVGARCSNMKEDQPEKHHRHAIINQGRAKQCEVYPVAPVQSDPPRLATATDAGRHDGDRALSGDHIGPAALCDVFKILLDLPDRIGTI